MLLQLITLLFDVFKLHLLGLNHRGDLLLRLLERPDSRRRARSLSAELRLEANDLLLELGYDVCVLADVVLDVQNIPLHVGLDVLGSIGVLEGVVSVFIV